MPVGLTLVDELLRDEGSATIKERATEAVLLVDKYGSPSWKFESGKYRVRLDFTTRHVEISHDSGRTTTEDLDLFLRRLQVHY